MQQLLINSLSDSKRCAAPVRRWAIGLWTVLFFVYGLGAAEAEPRLAERLPEVAGDQARLVMVATRGCPFCLKFERQVAPNYANSPEGQIAPLVRVQIGSQALADFALVDVTPTFLVLKGRQELGRFTGYPGIEGFWIELNDILTQHDLLSPKQSGELR